MSPPDGSSGYNVVVKRLPNRDKTQHDNKIYSVPLVVAALAQVRRGDDASTRAFIESHAPRATAASVQLGVEILAGLLANLWPLPGDEGEESERRLSFAVAALAGKKSVKRARVLLFAHEIVKRVREFGADRIDHEWIINRLRTEAENVGFARLSSEHVAAALQVAAKPNVSAGLVAATLSRAVNAWGDADVSPREAKRRYDDVLRDKSSRD